MPQVAFDADALASALDLLRTPRVLEVLTDLVDDRSPYNRSDDRSIIDTAVAYLCSVGAVVPQSASDEANNPPIQITPQGRRLFQRLKEIEDVATRLLPRRDRSAA